MDGQRHNSSFLKHRPRWIEALKKLADIIKPVKAGCFAEQYREYPSNKAALRLIGSGIIGDACCMNISLAHEYG